MAFLAVAASCGGGAAPGGGGGDGAAAQGISAPSGPGACAVPGGPAPPVPRGLPSGSVGHAGRWLTDAGGRVLLLHGVNVVAKTAPFDPCAFGFDDADAAWLAGLGLEVVRVGVLASGVMPAPGRIAAGYLDRLADTVAVLGRHHVYVVLDLHQDLFGPVFGGDGFPAWMTLTHGAPERSSSSAAFDYATNPALQQAFQSLWDDDRVDGVGLQQYVDTMLTALARRFASDPWVLGYELLNEPWPGTDWVSCSVGAGCPAIEAAELGPFYAGAVRAIRAVDRTHLVFLEPFSPFNLGVPTHLALPPGARGGGAVGGSGGAGGGGLAFHQYGQVPVTEARVLAEAVAWSASTGGALLDTEWSATGGDPSTITAQADLEDAALLPWTYWVLDDCSINCSPARAADLLLDPTAPPTGANVNAAVTDAVVRPYPVAVAGTPTLVRYDAGARLLDVTWSTARADGRGRFGAGALSALAVPRLDYPDGYGARVSGGRVASAPCAPVLLVAQAGGAARVALQIKPDGPGAGGGCRGRSG